VGKDFAQLYCDGGVGWPDQGAEKRGVVWLTRCGTSV